MGFLTTCGELARLAGGAGPMPVSQRQTGTALLDAPAGIWEVVPRPARVVEALARGGRDAGCRCDHQSPRARRAGSRPDKETPLWAPDELPIDSSCGTGSQRRTGVFRELHRRHQRPAQVGRGPGGRLPVREARRVPSRHNRLLRAPEHDVDGRRLAPPDGRRFDGDTQGLVPGLFAQTGAAPTEACGGSGRPPLVRTAGFSFVMVNCRPSAALRRSLATLNAALSNFMSAGSFWESAIRIS